MNNQQRVEQRMEGVEQIWCAEVAKGRIKQFSEHFKSRENAAFRYRVYKKASAHSELSEQEAAEQRSAFEEFAKMDRPSA